MSRLMVMDKVQMTSKELVDLINSTRVDGGKRVLHKHFLAKVPLVLGAETSAKFLADLSDSYGRMQKAYIFPKREACLMAMSYSYELQALVFDRMTKLEQVVAERPSISALNRYCTQLEDQAKVGSFHGKGLSAHRRKAKEIKALVDRQISLIQLRLELEAFNDH